MIDMNMMKAVANLLSIQDHTFYAFITSGTGIPDETAIDWFKHSCITVITRDGSMYRYGKKVEENNNDW